MNINHFLFYLCYVLKGSKSLDDIFFIASMDSNGTYNHVDTSFMYEFPLNVAIKWSWSELLGDNLIRNVFAERCRELKLYECDVIFYFRKYVHNRCTTEANPADFYASMASQAGNIVKYIHMWCFHVYKICIISQNRK